MQPHIYTPTQQSWSSTQQAAPSYLKQQQAVEQQRFPHYHTGHGGGGPAAVPTGRSSATRLPPHHKPTTSSGFSSPAPPNQSLLDEFPPAHHVNVRKESRDVRGTPVTPTTHTSAAHARPSSIRHRYTDTHTDPFYEAPAPGLQQELESWVTVFGFPPSRAAYVLQRFEAYGDVVEHRMGAGNWMHIRYATVLQAKKALGKNGKVFEGVLMIGVCACIDADVVRHQKRHPRTTTGTTNTDTYELRHGTASYPDTTTTIPSSASQTTPRYTDRPRPEPQRGFFSKAMDNIFLV